VLPFYRDVILEKAKWSGTPLKQTVLVADYDSSDMLAVPIPDGDSTREYMECEVLAISCGSPAINSVTFESATLPSKDLKVHMQITTTNP